MSIKEWLRRQAMAITLAVTNVQKNALNQEANELTAGSNLEQKKESSDLLQALLRGEVNQEVKDLRWRTYKVMKAAEKKNARLIPKMIYGENGEREFAYDEEGSIIFESATVNPRNKERALEKVVVDLTDNYPVKMVVKNEPVTNPLDSKADENMVVGYSSKNLNDTPIKIIRDFVPKFEIENYAKKMVVRTISDTEVLLEFYISKYIDPYNASSKMLVAEMNKILTNGPDKVNSLEIKEVGFISDNTIGSDDFMGYAYDIIGFDKIVDFDGYYVLKFKATVTLDGEDLMEKYREAELDRKYNEKEQRKMTI